MEAHPRVCGENEWTRPSAGRREGSSPRVRGKRQASQSLRMRKGLIPACAGKTPTQVGMNRCVAGSSPRVRGKLTWTRKAISLKGLIPACAGKTGRTTDDSTISRAHPRVCGENTPCCALRVDVRGSSPRVRGKLHFRRIAQDIDRLIPACAGKTLNDLEF